MTSVAGRLVVKRCCKIIVADIRGNFARDIWPITYSRLIVMMAGAMKRYIGGRGDLPLRLGAPDMATHRDSAGMLSSCGAVSSSSSRLVIIRRRRAATLISAIVKYQCRRAPKQPYVSSSYGASLQRILLLGAAWRCRVVDIFAWRAICLRLSSPGRSSRAVGSSSRHSSTRASSCSIVSVKRAMGAAFWVEQAL